MDNSTTLKKRTIFFAGNVMVSVLAYLVLISNALTNTYDGMWKGSYYTEYDWPLQIGRWFWKYVGLLRGSISPEPFTSVLSIMLYVFAACLIIDMLNIWNKSILASLVIQGITINEAVCIALSYRYMSPTFAFSFLMSVLAIYVVYKYKYVSIPVAVIAIAFMLGTYQANLGTAVFLTMSFFIIICLEEKVITKSLFFLVKSLASIGAGCIVYKILWTLILKRHGIQAADYQNAGDISIKSIIVNLPKQLVTCYKTYFMYYSGKLNMKNHFFQSSKLYVLVFVVLLGVLLFVIGRAAISKRSALCIAATAVAFILFPPAVGAVLLLTSPGTELSLQMTMAYAIHCPLLLALIIHFENNNTSEKTFSILKKLKLSSYCTAISVVCALYLLYGSFLMVSLDQHVMLVSRTNTLAFMNRVVNDLESRNGELSTSEIKYVFIGRPCNNVDYRKDETWDLSNNYARYGDFALVANCNIQSYGGLNRDLGIQIPYCDHGTWHSYEENEYVQSMPAYPNEGYVQVVDGNYVVKLS